MSRKLASIQRIWKIEPYNIDIRKIWNARLEHKKITKAEYYRPHEEVSNELAKMLDKKYGFDGGVYYEDEPWWEGYYE